MVNHDPDDGQDHQPAQYRDSPPHSCHLEVLELPFRPLTAIAINAMSTTQQHASNISAKSMLLPVAPWARTAALVFTRILRVPGCRTPRPDLTRNLTRQSTRYW